MSDDSDTAEIRALIEEIDAAHHDKDAAAIVAHYTPDATVFDLAPPLSQTGVDLRELEAWLDTWAGPVNRESRDLDIRVSGDLALCHGFFRISATTRDGSNAIFWMRATLGLTRDAGAWKIVHEHASVPFYMDGSYRAAVDLEPA